MRPTRMALSFAAVVSALNCVVHRNTTQSVHPLPTRLATLDGRVITTAPPDPVLRDFLGDVQTQLSETPPGQSELDARSLGQWVRRRRDGLRRLAVRMESLANRGTDTTLAAVVGYALVASDLYRGLVELPLPSGVRSSPELSAAWRDALHEQSRPMATHALPYWNRCVSTAPNASPPLRQWTAVCSSYAIRLRAETGSTPPAQSVLPRECTAATPPAPVSPLAPSPSLSSPMEFAFVYSGPSELDRPSFEALSSAVRARVQLSPNARWISPAEVDTARALSTAHRMTPDGPVCRRAPPWTAIIGRQHNHLVVATATARCTGPQPTCTLDLNFHRPGAPTVTEGLPQRLRASLDALPTTPARWSFAVSSLAPAHADTSNILGALSSLPSGTLFGSSPSVSGLGISLSGGYFRALDLDRIDPAMNAPRVLSTPTVRHALSRCIDGPVESFAVSLTVSPTGEVTHATVAPRTAPRASEATTRCLEDALRTTAWPCTPTGAEVPVVFGMCAGAR